MEFQAAEQAFERETTVGGLLQVSARVITEATGAFACAVSRLVGELIVDMANFSRDNRRMALGYGYLLSDYPLTKDAVDSREPRMCSLLDDDCDEKEAALLRELGFESLLMAPLECRGQPWGLVEVYANGRQFAGEDASVLTRLVERAGEQLERVEPP